MLRGKSPRFEQPEALCFQTPSRCCQGLPSQGCPHCLHSLTIGLRHLSTASHLNHPRAGCQCPRYQCFFFKGVSELSPATGLLDHFIFFFTGRSGPLTFKNSSSTSLVAHWVSIDFFLPAMWPIRSICKKNTGRVAFKKSCGPGRLAH